MKTIKHKNIENKLLSIVATLDEDFDKAKIAVNDLISSKPKETEIILLMNNDSQEISSYCEFYKSKNDNIVIMYKEKFQNLQDLKNEAVKQANGKYLLFLDTDSKIVKEEFEKFYDSLDGFSEDVLVFDYYKCFENKELYSIKDYNNSEILMSGDFSYKKLPEKIFNLWNVDKLPCFIKKDFIQRNKISFCSGIDFEDVVYGLYVMLLAQKIKYIDSPLLEYKINKNVVKTTQKSFESLFKEIKKFESILYKGNKNKELEQSFYNRILKIFQKAADNELTPRETFIKQYLFEDVFAHFDFRKYNIDFYDDENKKLMIFDYIKPIYLDKLYEYLNENKESICPVVINTTYDSEMYNASVIIESIKQKRNHEKFYDIYVLCYDNLKHSIKNILENLSDENVRVKCIMDFKNRYIGSNNYNIHLNSLFFAASVSEYDKILSLSANSLVLSDISDIFEYDINDYAVGCCYDKISYIYNKNNSDNIEYSSDVMLINSAFWRENKDIFSKNMSNQKLKGVINLYKNQIKKINAEWNVQYCNILDENNVSFLLNKKRCKILNYSAIKPWNNPQIVFADIWWNIAKKTPLYETIVYQNLRKITDLYKISDNNDFYNQDMDNEEKCISVDQEDFDNFVRILNNDVKQSLQNKKSNKTEYIDKILSDNEIYGAIKKYIIVWFKYEISLGLKRKELKSKLEELQLDIAKYFV